MNILKIFLSFLITLVLTIASGCKDNSTNPPTQTGELIPLALNNMWVLKSESYDSTGAILSTRIDTMRITGDTLINNEKWFIFNYSKHSLSTNRSDGYYSYYETPILEYKYPAKVGDVILFPDSLKREVISTNVQITAGNATYTVYHYYDYYINNVTDLSWNVFNAPNIGTIRIEAFRKKSQQQKYITMKVDLISYKLN